MRNVTLDRYIRDDVSNIILLLKQGQERCVCGPGAPSYCTTTAKRKRESERERRGDLAAKHVQQLKQTWFQITQHV